MYTKPMQLILREKTYFNWNNKIKEKNEILCVEVISKNYWYSWWIRVSAHTQMQSVQLYQQCIIFTPFLSWFFVCSFLFYFIVPIEIFFPLQSVLSAWYMLHTTHIYIMYNRCMHWIFAIFVTTFVPTSWLIKLRETPIGQILCFLFI